MKVQARRGPQPGRQCGQVEIEEVEFFGEAEVFGQMAVSTVGRLRHINEGFVGRKADLTDKPVADRQPAAVLTFGKDLQAAQKERVPQRGGDRRLGIYIEADAAAGPQPSLLPLTLQCQQETQPSLAADRQAHLARRHRQGVEDEPVDCQRRQADIPGRPELADRALDRAGLELGAPGQQRGSRERAAGRLEVGNRAARERPQIVRVEDAEQGLRELGVGILELLRDARRHQREGFDHPFHVGVVAALAGQQQLARQLGIAFGELPRVAAQEGELPLVVGEEILHGATTARRARLTEYCRLVGRSRASKATGS